MIKTIEIQNFRGVKQGKVDGLSPLSILVGPNNCGKSTVLEALCTVGLGTSASQVAAHLLRRGGAALDALDQVVSRGADSALLTAVDASGQPLSSEVSIGRRFPERVREARDEGLNEPMKTLWIRCLLAGGEAGERGTLVDPHGKIANDFGNVIQTKPYHPRPVDVIAVRKGPDLEDAFSDIQRSRTSIKQIIASLQKAMPGLTDMQILKSAVTNEFVLHTFRGDEPPVPVYVAGDGLKRYLTIAAACVDTNAPSVALLEEPESFQHPRYLAEMVAFLVKTASPDHQIVLATHSMEFIDLLLEAASDEAPFPTVHRLRLNDGVLSATTLTHTQAKDARTELLQDLRA